MASSKNALDLLKNIKREFFKPAAHHMTSLVLYVKEYVNNYNLVNFKKTKPAVKQAG